MNEIIELLKDSKNDEKLEQALISSYNSTNCLPLHLIPHRFRNKGFFYNECLRKHQYDLIPNLSSEEIKTLKKKNEIEINMNDEGDDEKTIDLTNASDEEVRRAFQLMTPKDNLVVVDDDNAISFTLSKGEIVENDLFENDYDDYYFEEEEPELKFLSAELQNNKKVVLKAVQENGLALEFASPFLQGDKVVALEAVNNHGMSLQFASTSLQNDKEIVLAALKNNSRAYKYASESLRNNKEVFIEAVKDTGSALEFASAVLRNNKELVLLAVKQFGGFLEFASSSLQNNKEVVIEAIKNYGIAIKYASDILRNDKEVVMYAVKNIGNHSTDAANYLLEETVLKNVSVLMQKDKEIVIEAIKNDSYAF